MVFQIPKSKKLANNIKKIRLSKNETMEEFGKHFTPKAHKSLVSKWEKGLSQPNQKRLNKIAELGDMSINNLLYGDPVTFLYDNLELEDEYEFGSIKELTSKGKLKIVEMCIREYQEHKLIDKNDFFNPIKKREIVDFTDLLYFSNKNVASIMNYMIELMDMTISRFDEFSKEDIKKVSDTNLIYKKYAHDEEITSIDKLNNFLSANNLDLENKLYKYQSENFFVADVINDLIKYGIHLSEVGKDNEIDEMTERNIIKFLRACLHVDDESAILKNTVLENSNLKEYIKNGLVDDLDILSQVLNEKYKNQ